MSRKASLGAAAAVAALFGAGIVVAQDTKKDKPLEDGKPLVASSELKSQCESALKTKEYLRDLKVTFFEEGAGKIVCEGAVPSKVHACALYLTCMSIHGVAQVDLSKLRVEHWGSETTPPAKPGERLGTDVQKGLDQGVGKAIAPRKLGLYAVVINPDERGVTTTPAGAKTFTQSDVIVIGDVPVTALPGKGAPRSESPQGNPANQDPNKNTQTPADQQPVAPHNPGAYPDNPK